MSHGDDTPPERDILGYLVRLSSEFGEFRVMAERHQQHIMHLREDVCTFRDEVRAMAPVVEQHTGEIKSLRAQTMRAAARGTKLRDMAAGALIMATLVGGAIGALAALGVFK